MTHDTHGPKPLSPSSLLKLLRAQGPGSKVELQPEHISALDAALAALHFQAQVRHLVQHGPHSLSASASAKPHGRPERDPRSERPAERRSPKAPARPSEGSGSIWTPEEEERLVQGWRHGTDIFTVAEAHKRSAAACFSRLVRLKAVQEGEASAAALFLIKRRASLGGSDPALWLQAARAQGFGSSASAPEAPAAEPPGAS